MSPSSPLYPTASAWLHILFGDATGGGHLSGQGIEGKTEFPEYWTISRIESAILMAQLQHLHRHGKLANHTVEELVDGIILRVVITADDDGTQQIETAYPLRGNGVFRNSNGASMSKPLLAQDEGN